MRQFYSLLICSILFFAAAGTASGARPTSHASALSFSGLHCNSVIISWTNGNGNARLIVAREGSPTSFAPSDNTVYSTPLPDLGSKATLHGGNNYIVFNSSLDTFVRIDSLKPCTDYYFTIYEHDNSGSNTLYLTNGAPSIQVKTYCLNLDFDIKYHDSCQSHNSYEFTNKSVSTIPGVSYEFDFGDGTTSASSPVTHSYTISGLIPAKIKATTSVQGCPATFARGVRVYQKKVVYFDWADPRTDTSEQCFTNNIFKVYTGNYPNPLLCAYRYRWFTPTDTSDFSFFNRHISVDGRIKISLEVSIHILKGSVSNPTGCKDTMSFFVNVPKNLVLNAGLNQQEQRLDTNRYIFSCTDTGLSQVKWYFGDGDSSSQPVDTHSYTYSNRFLVTLKAMDKKGCPYEKTMYADVLPIWDTTLSVTPFLTPASCRVYPNPAGNIITIELDRPISSVSILNMNGQAVREFLPDDGSAGVSADISMLPRGLYMLTIRAGQETFHQMVSLRQ